MAKNDFPKWNEFTPAFAAAELPRLLAEGEKAVAEIEVSAPTTYEELVWKLDDALLSLWRTWGYLSHMTSVVNSDEWRKVEADFQPKVVEFSLRVGQSRPLYDAEKSILPSVTDPVKRRILEKTIQGAELAGVSLEGETKARFNEIQTRLAKLAMDFSNEVLDATNAFKFEKGGKTYTIDDANYPITMKDNPDREVRETLYRARSTRAPKNTERIAEMLALRKELAGILGFKNYAELSLATKCAPSVAAVFAMIDELDTATKTIADTEEAELKSISAADIATLEPWDYAYYAERLRERKYSYSEEELKKHFEFEKVLAGLFRMSKFLFDIDVEEVTGTDMPPVWHKDVRFFAVKRGGETVAHFYLDPYVRNGQKRGGAWMNEFRNRCDRRDETPISLIVLNLPDERPCLMQFREVETIFHEFGHALQCMLTTIGEEGAAGINLVEWDAVEVASQFMENWCLDDRTGIFIPDELKAKVKAAKNFRAASACRRQLSFAKTDLLIHSGACDNGASADDVKCEVFRHFGFPMIEGDIFLNAFTHIFAGGYSAGYYGYKWSEVMSADCYGAFEEAGLTDDEAMRRIGAAYRDTVLGLGGSVSAYEVFTKFRGRRPTTAAILRQQGLQANLV